MPKVFDYDLFVIGAGSGGVRAARVSSAHGAKVAVAEEHKVGGTCVIRGCVPKKLLVYGAHFAEDLADARRFGWDVPDCRFDWVTLRDNVLAEVARLEGEIDQLNAPLPALASFVLPGGAPAAAALHLARTVCRRAERRAVALGEAGEAVSPPALRYLNRLSDLLFVAARWANDKGAAEVFWKSGATR